MRLRSNKMYYSGYEMEGQNPNIVIDSEVCLAQRFRRDRTSRQCGELTRKIVK